MLPDTWGHAGSALPQRLGETILVTVHPDHVAPAVLALIDIVLAIGPSPEETLAKFGKAAGKALAWPKGLSYQPHRVVRGSSGAADRLSPGGPSRAGRSASAIVASTRKATCAGTTSISATPTAGTT